MRDLDLGDGILVPAQLLRGVTSRAGGPGGQNVNKVETRVEAVWDLDGSAAFSDAQKARIRSELQTRVGADGSIRVVSQRHRSQARNREAAIERLRELVAESLRPRRKRRATRPTQASQESRMQSKRRRAETKRGRRSLPED